MTGLRAPPGDARDSFDRHRFLLNICDAPRPAHLPTSTLFSPMRSFGCRIPSDASILIVKPEWLDKIFDEDKDMEVRGSPCDSKIGKLIYFCPSGASAVTGTARIVECLGPLSQFLWDELRPRHKVPGPRTYGDKTYAWVLSQVQRMPPKPIKRNASVIWQTGPGGC